MTTTPLNPRRAPEVLSALGHHLIMIQDPYRDASHIRSRATHTLHLIWQSKASLEPSHLSFDDSVLHPTVWQPTLSVDQTAARFVLHSMTDLLNQLESAMYGIYKMLLDVEEGEVEGGEHAELIEDTDGCAIVYDGIGEKMIRRGKGDVGDGLRGRWCDIVMTMWLPNHIMDIHMNVMAFLLGLFNTCVRLEIHAALDHKTQVISINIPLKLGGKMTEEERKNVRGGLGMNNTPKVVPRESRE